MKKDKKAQNWKGDLWNGIGELLITFAILGIGLGIAFCFPYEAIKNIPFELFLILGGIVLFIGIGVIALIIYLIYRVFQIRKGTPK